MSKTTLLALVTLGITGWAQTAPQAFHVTSVRDWTVNDPQPSSHAFKWLVVSGTMGGLRYTTEQMMSFGTHRLLVGTDYPVLKTDEHAVTVLFGQDKKGRNEQERLDIVATEEQVTK